MINKYISIRCSLVAITIFFATIQSGQAISVLDQQQPIIDKTAWFVYGIGGSIGEGDRGQKLAQVVTAGMSGFLTEVHFPLAGAELLVEIQDVAGGLPSGAVLTSELFSSVPWSNTGFASLVFSKPIFLKQGDAFAIVLSSTVSGGLEPGPVGNPYSGGDAFFDAPPNAPGWLPLSWGRFDLPFQTFVELTSVIPEPSTFLLVGTGLLGLAGYGRRKFFKK